MYEFAQAAVAKYYRLSTATAIYCLLIGDWRPEIRVSAEFVPSEDFEGEESLLTLFLLFLVVVESLASRCIIWIVTFTFS